MKALTIEIDRAALVTTWTGQTMMNSAESSFSFQVGTMTDGGTRFLSQSIQCLLGVRASAGREPVLRLI